MRAALYFRVSSRHQTSENQFEDLLQEAKRDDGRDWNEIRTLLSRCIREEEFTTAGGANRTVYRIRAKVAEELAEHCVYIEQGRSAGSGARRRPMFERMRRDAAVRKFDRLLVWKVSRLGRDMREVIATVYELSDLGVIVNPVKSQTGPITSTMGKLMWAIQSWYAEMENDERSETIRAGQARARAAGKEIGRPRVVVDRDKVVRLRDEGRSWSEIESLTGVSATTVRRAYHARKGRADPCQKPREELA